MEYFTVKQIAEQRNVSERAIYKQIENHKPELSGHSRKMQGRTWYDEIAVKILEDAANQSAPAIIESGDKLKQEQLQEELEEVKKNLEAAKKLIVELQQKENKLLEKEAANQKLIAEAEVKLPLLEETTEENKLLREQKEALFRESLEEKSRADLNELRLHDAEAELQTYERTIFGLYRKKSRKRGTENEN